MFVKKTVVIYLLISLILALYDCQWLEKRALGRKQMKEFHLRLVWKQGRPEQCAEEYVISHFRRDENSQTVNLMGTDKSCLIFFQLVPWQKTYSGSKVIISAGDQAFLYDKPIRLKFEDIGWGYKIIWEFEQDPKKYVFHLFMRPGVDGDPFNPKDMI